LKESIICFISFCAWLWGVTLIIHK
jgi:hypothetical protein